MVAESILTEEFFRGLTGHVGELEELVDNRVSDKRPLAPTLVIGLGGTGVEAITRLKQRLSAHYQGREAHSEMIKFLAFDTIAAAKHPNKDVPKTLSEADDEYVCLSTDFNAFAYLRENYAKDKDLREWWDNRYSVSPQYQEYGAKRIRQLGRLFLHHKHLQVEALIQQKVAETCTLYEDFVRGQNLADVGSNFRVYAVTSTCGGTGSGIFLDILYKVWRAVMTQGRVPEVRAFIFLPGLYEEEARKRSLELVQAHRANAYAFLKELDYFLTPGSDLNQYILDARTRDSSQRVAIPAGNLVKYAYIIDRQLGNLGNLDRPEDAYDLVSDAMYQMIITPVGQEEEGVGLTNIDAIVDPGHLREGKRTAYSSLGLSRVLFPRQTLHTHLAYHFLSDLINLGLTANEPWMDETLRNDERLKGLSHRLGTGNLQAIDSLSRPALDLLIQCPSQSDLQKSAVSSRIDVLTKEKDLNDSRISQGLTLIDQEYRPFESEAKREAVAVVANLVNNCEFGVVYAKKVLLAVKKQLRSLLEDVRGQKAEYQAAKLDSERQLARKFEEMERLVSKQLVAFRTAQVNKKSAQLALVLRQLTESTLMAKVAEKKEALLEVLVGQEQVVEQRLANEDIVVEKHIAKSLIDQEIDKLILVTERLSELADRAETKARERVLAKADRGATITTQIFPPRIMDFLNSSAFSSLYRKEIGRATVSRHLKQILARMNETEELHGQGLYNLSEPAQELDVKRVMITLAATYVRTLFRGLLKQTVVDAATDSVGRARFGQQVMANLFELSQPCWNYEVQKAHDPGMTDLPRTYSLGYSDPDILPVPKGHLQPGLVRTAEDHQITLLQCQHGLPLFALRVIAPLRADYKHYMRISQTSGSQPLHLHQSWTRDVDALPDLKMPARLSGEALREFALGLFSDYLILKKDAVVCGLLSKRPIDQRDLRGYVFSSNGRDYYAVKLVDRQGTLQMGAVEHLSTSGRLDAAEGYANQPDLGRRAGQFIRLLEKHKQYHLISDLEEYIERLIVPEVRRIDDEEEREILEREYEALTAYLDELRYQKSRGLPLAG